MLRVLEQIAGAALVLLIMVDVFLTVLYARVGSGLLSGHLARGTWWLFQHATGWLGEKRRETALSFCGPMILLIYVFVWAAMLVIGTAMVLHPALGTSIRKSNGPTPTDFVTAMYAAGNSMAIIRASDLTPLTAPFRIYFLFNSLLGASIISLTLTYLMQVYSALQRRNALGYQMHVQSAETGDAAELIAGMGSGETFDHGYTNLATIADAMSGVQEAHHFYPVLFYFRFPRAIYSVAYFTLMALDAVTLMRSALNEEKHGWLASSVAAEQLWRSALLLGTLQEQKSRKAGAANDAALPSEEDAARWRRRYRAAVQRMGEAGIRTTSDSEAGATRYVSLRTHWDERLKRAMQLMGYTADEIDPMGQHPERGDERRPFAERLTSFGPSRTFGMG